MASAAMPTLRVSNTETNHDIHRWLDKSTKSGSQGACSHKGSNYNRLQDLRASLVLSRQWKAFGMVSFLDFTIDTEDGPRGLEHFCSVVSHWLNQTIGTSPPDESLVIGHTCTLRSCAPRASKCVR